MAKDAFERKQVIVFLLLSITWYCRLHLRSFFWQLKLLDRKRITHLS